MVLGGGLVDDRHDSKAICGLSRSNFTVPILEKVILESAMLLRSFSCVGRGEGGKIPWDLVVFFWFLTKKNQSKPIRNDGVSLGELT